MSLIIALVHMHEADTTWHGSKSDVRFASNLLRCIFILQIDHYKIDRENNIWS